MKDKFKTSKGRLTKYALACGYVESYTEHEQMIKMWHEGGPYIQVMLMDYSHNTCRRILWESFEKLSDARKYFDDIKRQLQLL